MPAQTRTAACPTQRVAVARGRSARRGHDPSIVRARCVSDDRRGRARGERPLQRRAGGGSRYGDDEHLHDDERERAPAGRPAQRPQRREEQGPQGERDEAQGARTRPRGAPRGRLRARQRRRPSARCGCGSSRGHPGAPRAAGGLAQHGVEGARPRHTRTGTPAAEQRCASRSRSSSRSRQTSRASRGSSTPVAATTASSEASGPVSSGGSVSTTTTAWPLRARRTAWLSGSAETSAESRTTKAPGRDGAAELSAQRPVLAEGPPTGLGPTEPEEQRGRADGDHRRPAPRRPHHRRAPTGRRGHPSRGSGPPPRRRPRRRHRGWSADRATGRGRRGRGWRRRRRAPRHPGRRRSW